MSMNVRRAILASAVLLLCTSLSKDANAYRYYVTKDNKRYHLDPYWPDKTHMIHISGCSWPQSDHSWVNEIQIAAKEWNEVRSMRDILSVKWRHCTVMNTLAKKHSKVVRVPIRGTISGYNFPTVNASTGLVKRVEVQIDSTDEDLFSASSHRCDEHGAAGWVRRIAMHEFGHSLGLAHGSYERRLNLMHKSNRPSLYCGAGSQVLPDADDAAGGRLLYPATTPHRDIAILAFTSPTGLANPLPVFGGPPKVCPGETVEQEYTIANRGTVDVEYLRRFYFSSNATQGDGDDIYVGVVNGESKSAGTPFGEFVGMSTITMAELESEHRVIMTLGGSGVASQSAGSSRENDWTYFGSRYAANNTGCP